MKNTVPPAFGEHDPLPHALLWSALGWLGFQLVMLLSNAPLHLIWRGYPLNGPVGAVAGALAVLAVYRHRFRPCFQGMLTNEGLRDGLLLTLPLCAYLLLSLASDHLLFRLRVTAPTLDSLSIACAAGFGEELCFRGLMLSTLMGQLRRRRRPLHCALLSAAVFGALHGANLLDGAGVGVTALQMVSAALMGLFWAAVFLRSGCLWPPILSHLLVDLAAMLSPLQAQGTLQQGIHPSYWPDTLMRLGLCGLGLWLLRGEKDDEMLRLWRRKWTPGQQGLSRAR